MQCILAAGCISSIEVCRLALNDIPACRSTYMYFPSPQDVTSVSPKSSPFPILTIAPSRHFDLCLVGTHPFVGAEVGA